MGHIEVGNTTRVFLNLFCFKNRISHQSAAYSLQENIIVEKENGALLDVVRSVMAHTNSAISFWGDALLTTL